MWAWIAIIAFVVAGGCVLVVLWPRRDWEFSASAIDVIAEYIEPESFAVQVIHRDLALHRAASFDRNARQLGQLFVVFRLGLVMLIVEVAAWMVALVERA